MKEQYVIKTRNDEDEYLAWNTRLELFYFTNNVKFAEKINSVELARKMKDCEFLKDSKYKCDIYKVVQSLEYVEGVFNENWLARRRCILLLPEQR